MAEIELTKKAEAYVAANYSQPEELPPLIVDCRSPRSIADSIEKLIDMLDAMSPDPDLEDGADDEPDADGEPDSDDEPMLGAPENHPRPCGPFAPHHRSPQGAQGGWFRGSMAWGEDEPSLGSLNHPGPTAQTYWGGGDAMISHDEVEDENEHAGDVLDEPHDAREDDEYSLGWTEHIDQRKAGIVDAVTWNDPEGEPDLGWTGHGRGYQAGEGMDDRELDDEREADPTDYDQPGQIMGGQGL